MDNYYKTIFISDLHLGSKGCQGPVLNDFLKHNHADEIYLVGDIIDLWKLRNGKWYWPNSHTSVIRRILQKSKDGTKIHYILGNHDETFRLWAKDYDLKFGNLSIKNDAIYETVKGKRLYIVHGDVFDTIIQFNRWMYILGDHAYEFALWFNKQFNTIRKILKLPYWSLSKWLKHNVKEAVSYLQDYERTIIKYCKKHNFDGVVCGHIHTPSIKTVDNIIFMNDGDFVENCSALVETRDGEFKIIYWEKTEDDQEAT